MTETRRGVELRAEPGRRLVGVVMKYGAEARVMLPDGRAVVEKFAAFAFADYLRSGETRVNMMHDPSITIATTAGARGRGNLALIDKPDALRMVAVLPSGPAFDAALALVADGSTAETSVEFRAVVRPYRERTADRSAKHAARYRYRRCRRLRWRRAPWKCGAAAGACGRGCRTTGRWLASAPEIAALRYSSRAASRFRTKCWPSLASTKRRSLRCNAVRCALPPTMKR